MTDNASAAWQLEVRGTNATETLSNQTTRDTAFDVA